MKSKAVFKHFGGKMATARALGITHQAVYQWGDDVPYVSQLLVQEVTDGKFKAGPHPARNKGNK